ncbi:hypothetical protein [Microcoleus sp. herbarium14]|uniref:hypothetical protein n=1 Tax=Microcoleus sp. herbarium14 TaxID=3055439 RepID=UPI002FD79236
MKQAASNIQRNYAKTRYFYYCSLRSLLSQTTDVFSLRLESDRDEKPPIPVRIDSNDRKIQVFPRCARESSRRKTI